MDLRASVDDLYRQTGHLVLRRCLRVLRDREEAMDATQWTFLRAFEVRFEVRSLPEALAWLYRTANHRCLWVLRNQSHRAKLLGIHGDALRGMPAPPIDVDLASRDLVEKALKRLDERTAELALLTWGMGMTNERAAELCGVSTRTVGRARVALETALRDLGAAEAS